MKTTKYVIAVAVVAAALPFSAKASPITITDLGTFSPAKNGQDPSNIQTLANTPSSSGGPGVDEPETPAGPLDLTLFRLNGVGATSSTTYGTFSVTQTGSGSNDQQFLTFNLINGWVLAGVSIHAGNGQSDEFFRVNDQTSGTSVGPFFGPGGPTGGKDLSNFDVLLENEGTSVPDGGTTLIMFGAAMVGLVGFRRYFAQASI
jgi:VPDSG-CTERM motif